MFECCGSKNVGFPFTCDDAYITNIRITVEHDYCIKQLFLLETVLVRKNDMFLNLFAFFVLSVASVMSQVF